MRAPLLAFALSVVTTAACSPPAEPQPDPEAVAQVGEVQSLPNTLPPPRADMPRYVGVWASTAVGCEVPAWTFRADGLSTQGEVSCTFDNVEQTPTGYRIDATCYAEAPPAPAELQISFAESARAMMIAGGPWSEAPSLVYCGPLPQE